MNPHNHGTTSYGDTGGHGQNFESAGGADRTNYTHNRTSTMQNQTVIVDSETVTIDNYGGSETRPKNAAVHYLIKYK